ncbi:cyclase family protein [Flavilitoribacter nigricans]|uniref:Cyclase n=1 Tax=Flavilitoribacter nigricans (strain ATCC 23147 / DSM 23189 / NBRC 102662 / NCIMB 1420 / SS-2) TaxID=1122177 RepID=A0A2D0N109_FLAN2|nr:cyclase family protein [Flavilitoribacter nigricans]PHN02120.1 cyclase [Flavilitoribacter nigricans DSM 23189 = NBRC 102662]
MQHLLDAKAIDLSLAYDDSISGYSEATARELGKDGWNARTLQIYSHAGTHMDAPAHFGLTGTIDAFEPQQLMGPAWVVDLSDISAGALISPQQLGGIADQVQPGDSLLLRTGWSRHRHDPSTYRNQLPRISTELAQWCVEKGIKMLGVEPPSVADVNDLEEVTRIHQLLFRGGVIIIEGLTNLSALSRPKVWLIALPLKIRAGDGAPARVIALEIEV